MHINLSPAHLSRWIDARSSWRIFAIAFVAMIMARYALMPWIMAQVGERPWPPPLDLDFAYSANEAFARIAAYGEQGRSAAPWFIFSGDLIYPIAYTLCFAVLLSLLARPLAAQRPKLMRLNLLPVAVFIADMLENSAITLMMQVYPTQPFWLGAMASMSTTMKWLLVAAMLLLPVILIIWRVLRLRKVNA